MKYKCYKTTSGNWNTSTEHTGVHFEFQQTRVTFVESEDGKYPASKGAVGKNVCYSVEKHLPDGMFTAAFRSFHRRYPFVVVAK
jgi:hypothetical protein